MASRTMIGLSVAAIMTRIVFHGCYASFDGVIAQICVNAMDAFTYLILSIMSLIILYPYAFNISKWKVINFVVAMPLIMWTGLEAVGFLTKFIPLLVYVDMTGGDKTPLYMWGATILTIFTLCLKIKCKPQLRVH